MTFYEVLTALINLVGDDKTIEIWEYFPEITIHVNDFAGFDNDWNEIMQSYNIELRDTLIEYLEKIGGCNVGRCPGGKWLFSNFHVILEYGSEDI